MVCATSPTKRQRIPRNESMSALPRATTRFRLRFMLEEFVLPVGDTLIGRSEECNITLFDPLISRRHARIRVTGDCAVLEDLESRNGCRVNGVTLRGCHVLTTGDRIRVGKHEFV